MKSHPNKTLFFKKKGLFKSVFVLAFSFFLSPTFAQVPQNSAEAFASAVIVNDIVGTSSENISSAQPVNYESKNNSTSPYVVIGAFTIAGNNYSFHHTFSSSEVKLVKKDGTETGLANSFNLLAYQQNGSLDHQKYMVRANISLEPTVFGEYSGISPLNITINYE